MQHSRKVTDAQLKEEPRMNPLSPVMSAMKLKNPLSPVMSAMKLE